MKKYFPSVYKKTKVTVLMFCLFLMMVNTCPVRSLLTSASLPNIEYSNKQLANPQKIFYNELSCSEGQMTKAFLLDFSKSSNSNLPLPFVLSALSLYLFLSVLSRRTLVIAKDSKVFFLEKIPLFLKNQSIII